MIYPQANNAGAGSTTVKRVPRKCTTLSAEKNKIGVARKIARGGGGNSVGGGGGRQLVQWKEKNVKEGVVIVDEQQLKKLIKREPIEKFYKLDPEPFATGLFASVRRCVARATGEVYAAKFSSRARYGEDCSAEIHHEIALLSLCSPSSRVIKLHDVFETSKEIIILMEFAPGGDLQTIIDDNLVPFEADVVNFVRQLVEGLAYMHERKIAHLDIKPQNLVMMGDFPNCDVKLCDFEISRVILESTDIREILGTPDYVAPEILHYEPITMAADLWSLGVTTYVLLTGFSPFGGETDQETFCNISRAQLDFPDELFEDVSDEAKDFIQKLLVSDPTARPSAKSLLRHRWLANRSGGGGPKPGVDQSKSPSVGENNRSHMSQKNLRKYLSKSREALFERVIQQQQQQQHRNDLRKTTLLSQYNKTRLCESHTSLVSKSREQNHPLNVSPSFSRSREKLYGLRSLSKSHEGLDLLKLSAGKVTDKKKGAARAYARAITADLSMLPLLRLQEMSLSESVGSLEGGDEGKVMADDVEPEKVVIVQEKKEKELYDGGLVSGDKEVSEVEMENGEVKEEVKEDSVMEDEVNKYEKTQLVKVEEGKVLDIIEKVDQEMSPPRKALAVQRASPVASLVSPKLLQDTIVGNTSVKPTAVVNSGTEVEMKTHEEEGSVVGKVDAKKGVWAKSEEIEAPIEVLPKVEASCVVEENKVADEKSDEEIVKKDICLVQKDDCEPETKVETVSSDKSDEEEPKFSVAQLVSAYNRHQEIVTKSSLEVTMTANEKELKIPPIIVEDPSTKFPTGPKALRLFIPDIDIEPSSKKTKKNRTKSYRTLSRSSTQESIKLEEENDGESDEKRIENLENTKKEEGVINNSDSCNVCNFVLEPPGNVMNVKLDKPSEINPNYLRSASLSSETSATSGCFTSESSGSMSWEDNNSIVTTKEQQWPPILVENREEVQQQWSPKTTNPQKGNKNLEVLSSGVNPWGRLCNGSYTRAMDKFNKNVDALIVEQEKPTRKISLTMLGPPRSVNEEEKVRRKSTSTMMH